LEIEKWLNGRIWRRNVGFIAVQITFRGNFAGNRKAAFCGSGAALHKREKAAAKGKL